MTVRMCAWRFTQRLEVPPVKVYAVAEKLQAKADGYYNHNEDLHYNIQVTPCYLEPVATITVSYTIWATDLQLAYLLSSMVMTAIDLNITQVVDIDTEFLGVVDRYV